MSAKPVISLGVEGNQTSCCNGSRSQMPPPGRLAIALANIEQKLNLLLDLCTAPVGGETHSMDSDTDTDND